MPPSQAPPRHLPPWQPMSVFHIRNTYSEDLASWWIYVSALFPANPTFQYPPC